MPPGVPGEETIDSGTESNSRIFFGNFLTGPMGQTNQRYNVKSKYSLYCHMFKTTPRKMRALLHRYFGTPAKVRELSIEEFYARRDGRLFNGRDPRPYIDICMDLELKKPRYEKMLEIHESGLFQNILDADEDWAEDNKDIIAKKLAMWDEILIAKQLKIAGARKIYEFAPEIYHEPNRNL